MRSGYRLQSTIKFDKEGESLQYSTPFHGSRPRRDDETSERSKIEGEGEVE